MASRSVAVNCNVRPIDSVAESGESVIEATGTRSMVTLAVPVFPSELADTTIDPGAIAVTTPVCEMLAMAGVLEVQATCRLVSMFPRASRNATPNCILSPTKMEAACGDKTTSTTLGGVTVRLALPTLLSAVAETEAVPIVTPLTTPLAETLATDGSLDRQSSGRPLSSFPWTSRNVAVSCNVSPAGRTAEAGDTSI